MTARTTSASGISTQENLLDLDDHALARWLATTAGHHLLEIRDAHEPGGSVGGLREAGDAGSHEVLMSHLTSLRPADAVLSEEATDDKARLSASRVWIIDPLDGTREFGEIPRDDWAVHVALWVDGDLSAGAVARPAMGDTLGTDAPPTAPIGRPEKIRLAVSRTRPPMFVETLAEYIGGELVPMGSAGIKATAVLDGTVDAYVHSGGQYEWDSAAPVAVARAAGLHTSRIDGSPLAYNQSDVTLPDLLICRPEIADVLLAAIADIAALDASAAVIA